MFKIRILAAIFAGTLVYVALALVAGKNGLWAEQQLEAQMLEVSLRTAEIAALNGELELEYLGLRDSPEVIGAYAKKLGYVAEGERLIKITGIPQRTQPVYSTGTALRHGKIRFFPEWVCKTVGICVALLMAVMFFLSDIKRSLENTPPQ
ncbi:MAG: septum formation initiator family protein [Spirochaetaceae bacterium]|jgi:cell division protein FtsB|nr:septum formation initiator family protein [Spirochaetaceae bacterium]